MDTNIGPNTRLLIEVEGMKQGVLASMSHHSALIQAEIADVIEKYDFIAALRKEAERQLPIIVEETIRRSLEDVAGRIYYDNGTQAILRGAFRDAIERLLKDKKDG